MRFSWGWGVAAICWMQLGFAMTGIWMGMWVCEESGGGLVEKVLVERGIWVEKGRVW